MTTFIDLCQEVVQVQELTTFLDRLEDSGSSRISAYKELVDVNKFAEILEKLVTEQDLVLQKANDTEIDHFYSIFFTLVIKLGEARINNIGPKIVEALKKDKENRKSIRLVVLTNLYNMYSDVNWRYKLLLVILEYALSSEQGSLVESIVENIEDKISELNLKPTQKRSVYDVVLQYFREESSGTFETYIKYLSTMEGEENESSIIAASADRTSSFLVSVLKHPDLFANERFLELSAVKHLEKSSNTKHQNVFKLFNIFSFHGVKQFNEFISSNPGLIGELGLNKDNLTQKIKILSLNTLAQSNTLISYADAAKAMDVTEDDVEMLVVECISCGILDARLDQLERKIIVKSAEARVYRKEEWSRLDVKLQKWSNNISTLLTVIQDTCKRVGIPSSTINNNSNNDTK
eukprot:TRINITY_DN1677_c1_g3_i1.p2 TRINITY_DN1677_c1_g3~~TRINITY_DN1677_c1_g3_i1.p2  ORF type:complete len:406 (-),score=97.94 TRINITY_DN1677_c1_g3_i1:1702-2919(-)